MAYSKQTWEPRLGTNLNRFLKENETTQYVELTQDPETITQSGTPFTADRMAHMEDGIENAVDKTSAQVVNGKKTFGKYPEVTEWFLPSKDELNEMYVNLHVEGVGGFTDYYYWSSSENSSDDAWGQFFTNGDQYYDDKNDAVYVRPVRAFTAEIGAYSLRDTGPAGGWIFHVDGMTYYEAAPADYTEGATVEFPWSNVTDVEVGTTGTAIGTGWQNTLDIIDQAGHTESAASRAASLTQAPEMPYQLVDKRYVDTECREIMQVTGGDYVILPAGVNKFNFTTSATNRTATLPAATGTGRRILIRKIDTGAGKVLIDPDGTDKITFRASLAQVSLTAQGDYWVLEDAASGFWELVDGIERFSGANDGVKYPDGKMEQSGFFTDTIDTDYDSAIGGYSGNTTTQNYEEEFYSIDDFIVSEARGAFAQSFTDNLGTSTYGIRFRTIASVASETVWAFWRATGRWYA